MRFPIVRIDRPENHESRYFPETDTLSILLLRSAGYVEGDDTNDPDVTLLYDRSNRIAEIVIEHASRRVDLPDLRRRIGFEEVGGGGRTESD